MKKKKKTVIICFKIQKEIIRIITKSKHVDFCRELFKKLEILPIVTHYIFFLYYCLW
jgi:hypothetical protein